MEAPSHAGQVCAGCWTEAPAPGHEVCSTGLRVLMPRLLTSPGAVTQERGTGEAAMFLHSNLRSHTLSFLPYLNDYTGQASLVWEETTKGHEYQKAKIMGAKWVAEKNGSSVRSPQTQTHSLARLP